MLLVKFKGKLFYICLKVSMNVSIITNAVTGLYRSEFEELAAPLFEKIRQLLLRLLEETGVKVCGSCSFI